MNGIIIKQVQISHCHWRSVIHNF